MISKLYNRVRDAGFSLAAIVVIAVLGVLAITIIPAIVGWAVVTVIGLFTTVAVSGYFTYAAIGIAVIIIVHIFP